MSTGASFASSSRLIVSLDLLSSSGLDLYSEILRQSRLLSSLGVGVKLNTGVHVCGYAIIEAVQNHCPVFADLKLVDTRDTTITYAKHLAIYKPRFLTVMGTLDDIQVIKEIAGEDTTVLAVSVLTDMDADDVKDVYRTNHRNTILRLGERALRRGADGLIACPHDVRLLRTEFGDDFEIVCPGIRPTWYRGFSGHRRTMTPKRAIQAGATRIIVGRPITEAKDIKIAVEIIIKEINSA